MSGNVSQVCQMIGVARGTLYAWLKRDPAFAARYQAIVAAHFEAWMHDIERRYPLGDV